MRVLSVVAMVMLLIAGAAGAQEPQPASAQEPQPASALVPVVTGYTFGDLAEVMRGILFPNSNILFDAQTNNPDDPVEAVEGDSTSARFATIYTGWEALENAAVALVEAANLIEMPRNCELDEDESGRIGAPAPVERDDWKQYVAGLRTAGQTAYEWARARNYDDFEVILMTGDIAEACSNCHGVYRDSYTDPPTPRCVPANED